MRRHAFLLPAPTSRRAFCGAMLAAAAALRAGPASAQAGRRPAFFKNLAPGHLGVKADSRQALAYAIEFGFEGVAIQPGDFAKASDAEIFAWTESLKVRGIRPGAAGLPVNFRGDDAAFRKDLALLPAHAAILRKLGVTRVATWISPSHPELPFEQNFERHRLRLGEAARILKDHGLRLGLEFVGPKTSRARHPFPFIHDQKGMLALASAIGTGNVGLLLDSWHWYTSHGTVEDLLRLTNADVVHVHVNDAPAGIPVDEQIDNRRRLPATTGVIDLKGFVNALVSIGYDGPVECEPFDDALRALAAPAALKLAIGALDRVWALIA